MLKIWGRRNSINVQKVMWAVAELGVAHERVDAGMAFGLVNDPPYRKLNPNGLVPCIEDDGTVLWESNVIVRYLAAKHAMGKLMPADIATRAKAEMWMDWQQTALNPAIGPMFWGLVRTPPEKRNLEAIEASRKSSETVMRLLDAALEGRSYLLGSDLTVADIPAGCTVNRWYALPIERPALKNVKAYHERLAKRPGYAANVMLPLT